MAIKRQRNSKKLNKYSSIMILILIVVVYIVLRVLIVSKIINSYYVSILDSIMINVVAAVSLNLVTGLLGQLVLGHAGFMLVGGYMAAYFAKSVSLDINIALPVGLLLGGFMAALIGALIGIPALRLRGDYLAIITLGFGEIIRVIGNNLTNAQGITGIPTISMRKSPAGLFTIMAVCVVVVVYFSYTYGTSRYGRAAVAIREDEIAAEASGVNTTKYKLITFTIAAFFAGIAGALYAFHVGAVIPKNFDFNRSIEILVMVVLGGMGSITGSIISATVLTALPEVLRGFSDYRMLVYSIVLILTMLFRPQGLLGRKEFYLKDVLKKLPFFSSNKYPEKAGGKK